MNRKEMKNLAKKIVKIEQVLQASTDAAEKRELEEQIFALTNHITSLEEMMEIDDMILSLLEEH